MSLGFLVEIKDGIGKVLGDNNQMIDVPANRIPEGLKPGMDFNYRASKRGHINIRPPAEPNNQKATNSPKDRQMYAIKRLMSPGHGPDGKGWSLAQASGIAGRFMAESGSHLDTKARNPRDPGTSEGIGQWNRERKAAMKQFSKKYNNAFDAQIDFFDHEIHNSPGERLALIALEKAKTPDEAATAMMHYERPGGYKPGNPTRGLGYRETVKNANMLAKMFDPNFTPQVTTEGPGDDIDAASAGAMASEEDIGNTTVDAGADQTIDPGQDTQETLADALQGSDGEGLFGAPQSVGDASIPAAAAQNMIAQGVQASAGGGYLPRLPTVAELFGGGDQ